MMFYNLNQIHLILIYLDLNVIFLNHNIKSTGNVINNNTNSVINVNKCLLIYIDIVKYIDIKRIKPPKNDAFTDKTNNFGRRVSILFCG